MQKLEPRRFFKRVIVFAAFMTVLFAGYLLARGIWRGGAQSVVGYPYALKPQEVARLVETNVDQQQFAEHVEWESAPGKREQARAKYFIDFSLQELLQRNFRNYKPDFGAAAVMDAEDGRVLAMVSWAKDESRLKDLGTKNLTTKASFPAASILKIVTATAAIDQGKVNPETSISFTGSNHTLYKKNIFGSGYRSPWAREMSVKKAFADSVNTVFGKLGVFFAGPEVFLDYTRKFHFNAPIPTDFAFETGSVENLKPDSWELVQQASGFTKEVHLSPIHAMLLSAAIANDGLMVKPRLLEKLEAPDGALVFASEKEVLSQVMKKETAESLRVLMRETLTSGTSRKMFRGFPKDAVDVGGKTGSLTGGDLGGKVDWFVGYGIHKNRKIALSALTVNEKYWTVKASFLGRRILENIFYSELSDFKKEKKKNISGNSKVRGKL